MGEAKRRGSYETRRQSPLGKKSNHSKNYSEAKRTAFNRARLGNLLTPDEIQKMREERLKK